MIYAIEFIFRSQYRFEKFNIGGIFVKRIISSKIMYYLSFCMVYYLRILIIGSKLNYNWIFLGSVDMAIVIYIP